MDKTHVCNICIQTEFGMVGIPIVGEQHDAELKISVMRLIFQLYREHIVGKSANTNTASSELLAW